MTYIPSVQVKVGIEKREHPERFCPKRNCLWRTGGGYCPRHRPKVSEPIHPGAVCSKCGRTVTEREYSKGESDCCKEGVVAEEFYR